MTSRIINPSPARVLVCWPRASGYMAACWRRLQEDPDFDLRIIAWDHRSGVDSEVCFERTLLDGLSHRFVDPKQTGVGRVVADEMESYQPTVVLLSGWHFAAYTNAIKKLPRGGPQVIMCMDTPWSGSASQRLCRFRHARLFRQVDDVLVAGERSWQYALQLGFRQEQVHRGVYAWDESVFERSIAKFATPHSFVYTGRLAPEKGLDVLVSAYNRYREQVDVPWELKVCGNGPLRNLMQPPIRYLGFTQPEQLPSVYANSSVVVLPSLYEPWGVALAEAMGSGLPAIATEACGAAIDLVRPYWNGRLVATGSVDDLFEAMMWFHDQSEALPTMSRNAASSASGFTSSSWATRVGAIVSNRSNRRAA